MTLQTWLADGLRAAGLTVLEVAGWQTRQTRDGFAPQGVVEHDTVTPPGLTREQEQAILRDGRPDLSGPLAQLGVHRDGAVSVVAAGRANHNGGDPNDGLPDPVWGNDAYGIEVFCYGGQPGHTEPWNAIQAHVVALVAAVLCKHHGWDVSVVQGHKETDPHRKIDPYGTSMANQRAATQQLLQPAPPAPTIPLEAIMDAGPILVRMPDSLTAPDGGAYPIPSWYPKTQPRPVMEVAFGHARWVQAHIAQFTLDSGQVIPHPDYAKPGATFDDAVHKDQWGVLADCTLVGPVPT